MRSLLDVNVLLALMIESHSHHDLALSWFRADGNAAWASCPATQDGFVRIASQLALPDRRTLDDSFRQLRAQLADPRHEFWSDDISLADTAVIDHSHLIGHKQLTDIRLLALAARRRGRLVTFDRGVPLKAIRGATAINLVVI